MLGNLNLISNVIEFNLALVLLKDFITLRCLSTLSEGSGTRGVLDALCSFFTRRDRIDVSWQIFYFTVFWPCLL